MFEKFGEFDSAEELNKKAEELKNGGDRKALIDLAVENGIDKEEAEDYMDGFMEQLANPLMAALGKLNVEEKSLGLNGVLVDWKDAVADLCVEEDGMKEAVRRKGKNLKECMAALLKFAFENKVQVSQEVVKATKVMHNGKLEPMRGPVYLGIPNKSETRRIIREYYGQGGEK